MDTNPRTATIVTAVSGVVFVLLAIGTRRPEAALAGGALLAAVAWGRAATRGDIARARRAGFEMVWREESRRARIAVGSSRTFVAELRNRSDRIVHVDGLRAVASEGVETAVHPRELDVLPGGFARIEVEVTGLRVGRRGVHGLALGAGGVGAAFEVPLTFANVVGVEVVPRAIVSGLGPPRGGKLRADPAAGRARNRRGDGTELREIRDIVPGDSFRKIAWRASARRGRLLVREMEVEEREVVWVVVDVSAEGWSGPVGDAPLDRAIDTAAAFAMERTRHGAAVGLALATDHVVCWSPPTHGASDLDRLGSVWLDAADDYGVERCGLSIDELLRLSIEHARPLDPAGLADLPRGDIDRLLQRLDALRARAPFQLPPPRAAAANELRDRLVRHYAASFGLDVTPRLTGPTAIGVAAALTKIARALPRATDVVVLAPLPSAGVDELRDPVARLRKRGVRVRWVAVDRTLGLRAPTGADAIRAALSVEMSGHARVRGSRLATVGIRLVEARGLAGGARARRADEAPDEALALRRAERGS